MSNDRELSWVDRKLEQCASLRHVGKELGLTDQSASLPVEQYQELFEALKAAREALESCKVEQHAIMRFDCGKVGAAKTKIDALGGRE